MTPEEILQALYDETLVGNAPRVLDLTNQGLDLSMEPQTLLFDALIPSLEEVGARFERGDFFVPEMLIAGRAMAGAMERLRPLLAETGVATAPGTDFDTQRGREFVRLSFAGSHDSLVEGLDRLEAWLA